MSRSHRRMDHRLIVLGLALFTSFASSAPLFAAPDTLRTNQEVERRRDPVAQPGGLEEALAPDSEPLPRLRRVEPKVAIKQLIQIVASGGQAVFHFPHEDPPGQLTVDQTGSRDHQERRIRELVTQLAAPHGRAGRMQVALNRDIDRANVFHVHPPAAGLEEGTPIPLAEALRTLKTSITADGVYTAQVGPSAGPPRPLTRLTDEERSVPLDDGLLMALLQEGAADGRVVLEHREDQPLLIRPPTAAELRWAGVTASGAEEPGGAVASGKPAQLPLPTAGIDVQTHALLFLHAKRGAYLAWIPGGSSRYSYVEVRNVDEDGRRLQLQPVSADRLRATQPEWVDASVVLQGSPRLIEAAAGLEEHEPALANLAKTQQALAAARDAMIRRVTEAWAAAIADDPLQVLEEHPDARSQPAFVFTPSADANDLAVVAIRQGYRVAVQLGPQNDPVPLRRLLEGTPTPHGPFVVEVGWADIASALEIRRWEPQVINTRAEALDILALPSEDDPTRWSDAGAGPIAAALARTREYLAAQAGLETQL